MEATLVKKAERLAGIRYPHFQTEPQEVRNCRTGFFTQFLHLLNMQTEYKHSDEGRLVSLSITNMQVARMQTVEALYIHKTDAK